MATRFFNSDSFNQSLSKEEPISRILFYSVMVHYVVFYILFGNPFLIPLRQTGEAAADRKLDIELLSADQIEPSPQSPLENATADLFENSVAHKRDFPAFSPGTNGDEAEEGSPEEVDPVPLFEDGMKTVEKIEPAPPAPKKIVRKLPRNMTGPEDCMLKVVAMVCPEGDAQCLTEYREFCENLSE